MISPILCKYRAVVSCKDYQSGIILMGKVVNLANLHKLVRGGLNSKCKLIRVYIWPQLAIKTIYTYQYGSVKVLGHFSPI